MSSTAESRYRSGSLVPSSSSTSSYLIRLTTGTLLTGKVTIMAHLLLQIVPGGTKHRQHMPQWSEGSPFKSKAIA